MHTYGMHTEPAGTRLDAHMCMSASFTGKIYLYLRIQGHFSGLCRPALCMHVSVCAYGCAGLLVKHMKIDIASSVLSSRLYTSAAQR